MSLPHGLYLCLEDWTNAVAAPDPSAWEALQAPLDDPWAELVRQAVLARWHSDLAARQALLPILAQAAEQLQVQPDLDQAMAYAYALSLLSDIAPPQAAAPLHTVVQTCYQAEGLEARLRAMPLLMVVGVLLDEVALRQDAARHFRVIIDDHLHPEGYLPQLVQEDKRPGSFQRQWEAARALVLTAQAYEGAGLWDYHNRGVSVLTAVAYAQYYTLFPDKWRWEKDVAPEAIEARLRQRGAFLEFVFRRARLRNMQFVMDKGRPFFDAYGGGATTLLCAPLPPAKPKPSGWRLFRRG
ncbi:MAG: alginate lyase family protein [Anaerolineae bacterium]|nr:alginate lyase family protein [Anaerolineae bacterium]MDW8172629.1 hypothetical protein [Anaerolineae bacterium]